MIQVIKENAGWVALVILAIMGGAAYFNSVGQSSQLGVAIDCQSVTCFTTVGILDSLQVDGTALFTGVTTYSGALKASSTLEVSGAFTAYSTSRQVGTTTIENPLKILPTNGVACIDFYATSTETRTKLVFVSSTTPTTAAYLGVTYGNCP